MTNFSAAVLALTFGPVIIAFLVLAIFHLLSFNSKLVVASGDEEKPEEKPTVKIKHPGKRWKSQGVSFERTESGHVSSRAKKLYAVETAALCELLYAEGPWEYEVHFKLIAKAHKRGGNKERGLHKAIVRKAGGRSFKKVCVLHSNVTGIKYAAYYQDGKKVIYNMIDWQ